VVLFTLSPRSPTLEERTITITPQMWFCLHYQQMLIDIVLYLIFIYAKIINIIVSFLKVLQKYFS
jgi:hypothetical protein